MAGIDAFALLVEEMKSDDVVEQVEAAKRINTIALGMGEEKARTQLLPFLRTCVDEKTDEILLAIAEVSGTMVKAVGGGEHAHNLVPILEALAEKDETIVRSKAVESLVTIGKEMPAKRIYSGDASQTDLFVLLKRLCSADFFPSRISAAGLFATVYPATPGPLRQGLRKQYETLTKDEMPMVRSAAFAHLPAFAEAIYKEGEKSKEEAEVFTKEVIHLFNELSADLQESVKEIAVENMVAMVKIPKRDEAQKHFGKFFVDCQREKCSSMRVNLAKNFVTLLETMYPRGPTDDQVDAFLQLLAGDLEVEVRNAAAANIAAFADYCKKLDNPKPIVVSKILPVLRDLSQPQDEAAMGGGLSNQQVRESIAEQICRLAEVLGRDGSINELLPLVKLFLADEMIELKRKVLSTVAPLVETLGAEAAVQHLVPEVLKMAKDTRWRVRLSVVETIPVYAQHLGMDLFNQEFKDTQEAALRDSIAHIRERAIANLVPLTEQFKEQWTQQFMFKGIAEAAQGTGPASYLGRITAVQAVGQLAGSTSSALLTSENGLVPKVVVPLARDKVSNVRIAASEALSKLTPKLKAETPDFFKQQIEPILWELSQDSDPDVKYFSELSLQM